MNRINLCSLSIYNRNKHMNHVSDALTLLQFSSMTSFLLIPTQFLIRCNIVGLNKCFICMHLTIKTSHLESYFMVSRKLLYSSTSCTKPPQTNTSKGDHSEKGKIHVVQGVCNKSRANKYCGERTFPTLTIRSNSSTMPNRRISGSG